MEIMVRAKAMGFTVAEVPISFVDRLYGESKLGGDGIVEYAKGVFNLWLKAWGVVESVRVGDLHCHSVGGIWE